MVKTDDGNKDELIFYLIPAIIFGTPKESKKIIKQVGKKAETTLFNKFNRRPQFDCCWALKFMTEFFGERTCQQSVEKVSELLVYASKKYPKYFSPISEELIQKSWKMIEKEESVKKVEDYSILISSLLNSPSADEFNCSSDYAKISFSKVEEGKVNEILLDALNGF